MDDSTKGLVYGRNQVRELEHDGGAIQLAIYDKRRALLYLPWKPKESDLQRDLEAILVAFEDALGTPCPDPLG